VFLSGDVHHAQFIGSPCNLRNLGSRPFVEVTTSGMTHTCDKNLFGLCRYALRGNTPLKYQKSPVVVDFNYGIIDIDLKSLEAAVSIKGRRNQTFLKKELDYGNQPSFNYCENYLFNKRPFLFEGLLLQVPRALVEEANLFLLFGMTLLSGGLSFVLSTALIAGRKVFRK